MEQLFNLPNRVKWFLGAIGLGGLVGTGAALGAGKWIFLIVLLAMVAVLFGGYLLISAWRRKKQNARMGSELQQHSMASPRSISDPGQRARLDDLRKKFETGVAEYRSRGKDLYKLPWYVIVGEPGSGKTEAVRHSNVGFPPGLQNELQGVGGTINMNWWFTNQAVILDTAGRLMFEEVKPGESSEWKEFLTLLKKNRPNCPINGLFLVIPSDSLIKDTADNIAAKAGKIAQQLDVIQRVLDVRFPVYVIVTKCDKINGFREFFDTLTDPQLQHQMMGWSNPDPLDSPFRPEEVDKYLGQVVQRLWKRRMGLLRDPIASPDTASNRRTDEVDALYALPHSLSLLSSRLRRYLETIFIAGEWSAKPLFLRGIYVTSSMQEGAALDADLAGALGVPPEELGDPSFKRDRAYFLRDVFVEKAFKEKGLVTRASNTKRMMRTQQILLFSVGFLALAAFAAFAWFGMRTLRSSVGDQSKYWHTVSDIGWKDKTWKQSIVPIQNDGSYANYMTNQVEVDGKKVSIGDFHGRLRDLASTPLKRNILFPTLALRFNENSKNAQRIVFETSVVKPVAEAARKKMISDESSDEKSQKLQSDALVSLIRLESEIANRLKGNGRSEIDTETAHKFLAPLLSYATGQEVSTLDTNLVASMVWTYSVNEKARGTWPPTWVSGIYNPSTATLKATNNLASNDSIRNGLDYFVRNATNAFQSQVVRGAQINTLRQKVKDFEAAEVRLAAAAKEQNEAAAKAAQQTLDQAKLVLDTTLRDTTNASAKLFAGTASFITALGNFRAEVSNSSAGALDKVKAANEKALRDHKDLALFIDVRKRLEGVQEELNRRAAGTFTAADEDEMKRLDETFLLGGSYVERSALYSRASKLWTEKRFQNEDLIGLKADPLDKVLQDQIKPMQEKATAYSGKMKSEFVQICDFYLKRADAARRDEFFTTYSQQASKEMGSKLGFPLFRGPGKPVLTIDQLKEAEKLLTYINGDMASPLLRSGPTPAAQKADWEAFSRKVASLELVRKAIISPDGVPGNCVISLVGLGDMENPNDKWRRDGFYRGIQVKAEGANTKVESTSTREDQELGKVPTQQKLQILQFRRAEMDVDKTYSLGDWGVFELLLKYNGKPIQKSDTTTWLVDRPVEVEEYKNTSIRLKLKFDRPLPELDNWPLE